MPSKNDTPYYDCMWYRGDSNRVESTRILAASPGVDSKPRSGAKWILVLRSPPKMRYMPQGLNVKKNAIMLLAV